ncbi:MAG: outer membrane receptor protein involved in Fe transport, partial [Parvibaculaceae bacterium]
MNVPKTSHRYLSQSTPYLSALMLSTSLAYAHPAHADEEAPLATTQTPAPLATSPHTLLETVVVTSTRANTPKAKHPGNVAQIDGQEVIEIQADHIEQIV